MRKLVTKRTVKNILPIKDADNIELAIIDGWQCVVKKNEFNIGDQGFYFEIDCLLPISNKHFKFFEEKAKNGYFRIKTIKLKGTLSQGLLLNIKEENIPELEDYSEYFQIKKYEIDNSTMYFNKKPDTFPSFIPKTDQERIQNINYILDEPKEPKNQSNDQSNDQIEEQIQRKKWQRYFERINKIRNVTYEETIKLDGSSLTIFINKGVYGVCSRNYQLIELNEENKDKENGEDNNIFLLTAFKLKIQEKLRKFYEETGRSIAVQGELIGPNIQHNYEKVPDYQWHIFDIFDIDNQNYILPQERRQIVKQLNLIHVPVLNELSDIKRFKNINEILEYAEGPSFNNKNREGIVFKSNEYIDNQIYSFKTVSNSYLLKTNN